MKIRKIFVLGKALREEVVLEIVSGEFAGTFKVPISSKFLFSYLSLYITQ